MSVCWVPDLDDNTFDVLPLGSSGFVAIVAASHRFAAANEVPLPRLAEETLIGLPQALNPALYRLVSDAMNACGVAWTVHDEVVGYENIAARVLAGEGVGIALAASVAAIPLDHIVYLPLTAEGPRADRILAWPKGMRPDAVQALVEVAEQLQDGS